MEKRKCQRFDVRLPAAFSGQNVAGGGIVINLSHVGCSIDSEELVCPTTFLALRLQLPEQYSSLRIEVAEVRWVSGAGFGVEFVHLRAEEQERLHRFVAVLEASQNN